MALSNAGAEDAGHHTAEVQQWHAAAPAIVTCSLTLHAGEAPKTTATGAHIAAAVTEAGAPCPRALGSRHHSHHLGWLLLDGHVLSLVLP